MTRRLVAALVAPALVALLGCAALEPPVPPPAAPPVTPRAAEGAPPAPGGAPAAPARPGVPVGNTASGGAIVSRGSHPAVVDSGPSAEALAVLATIPEPLPPGERVPPPPADSASAAVAVPARGSTSPPAGGSASPPAGASASSPAGASASPPAGASASPPAGASASPPAGASASPPAGEPGAAAAETTQVPVPAPTEPLGDRPEAFAKALADTQSTVPPVAAPAPASPKPDSCWRIQIAAPAGRKEADLKREAAESVLLVPVVVEKEKARYKLRTRDCMSREAARSLRRRAIDSGFKGAFALVEVKR